MTGAAAVVAFAFTADAAIAASFPFLFLTRWIVGLPRGMTGFLVDP